MREERIDTGGVPGMVYDPGDAAGLLLFGHGGTYSKDSERFVRICRTYADQTGLAVVCIDAVDHGERKQNNATQGLPPSWHSSVIPQMVDDWHRTVNGLTAIGPAIAYVGFSMGMIFGAPVVASMPSVKAAVFGVGGIPSGPWINDPPLRAALLDAASQLRHPQVLMLNVTHDEFFRTEDAHLFFDAVPGRRKRITFWEGDHDDLPSEAINQSVAFINEHIRPSP